MKSLADQLAVAFSTGRGLWLYEASGWTKLTTLDPEAMEATAFSR